MASEEMDRPKGSKARVTPLQVNLGVALVISAAGTAILGGALMFLLDNVWWLALGGLLSLLGAGVFLGRRCREAEPLYGVLLAIFYFGFVVVGLFGGELAERLPDPLPGLSIGDSTFFFVSPLLMLVAGVAGVVLGGRWSGPAD